MPASVEIVAYDDAVDRMILVGVPTFGAVSIEWHGHMMQLRNPLNRSVRHAYIKGREVGDARNEIVRQAVETRGQLGERFSHVLFIDDDVLVPSDALMRLLDHKRPIISGLYYAKTVSPQPLILKDDFQGVITDFEPGSVVECAAHGMGCTLIERRVFEAMEPPWFKTTRDLVQGADIPIHYSQTEDVFFLKRARELGFQPAVDTSLLCWHYSMAERTGYPIQAWQAKTRAA